MRPIVFIGHCFGGIVIEKVSHARAPLNPVDVEESDLYRLWFPQNSTRKTIHAS